MHQQLDQNIQNPPRLRKSGKAYRRVFKQDKTDTVGWMMIDNHPVQQNITDGGLTSDELAVLVYLLSKPDDWKTWMTDIRNRFGWGICF